MVDEYDKVLHRIYKLKMFRFLYGRWILWNFIIIVGGDECSDSSMVDEYEDDVSLAYVSELSSDSSMVDEY